MPEISTQTEERLIPEKEKAYLNLLIKYNSYSQDCVRCKGCDQKFAVEWYKRHNLKCKKFKTIDYQNCN